MKRVLLITFFLFALPVTNLLADTQCNGEYGEGPNKFSLATGSPGELNLLKALAEAFSAKNKAVLCWVKAGSGESLKLLKDKRVDMIMVHAPDAEKKAVQEGWAVNRILIGSNEFYIVGPPEDPAKIAEATSANDVFSRIEKGGSTFFSRGDNSGTHQKEMSVWANVQIKPEGNWYVVTKDFMKATLKKANDAKGYFMVDSSTWVAENKNLPNLKILFRGDKYLVNTYHTLSQPVSATPGARIASEFIEFVASKQGQDIIRNYGKDKFGEALYSDADYAKKYDD
ncbi:MAG: substrate-binding domain-containing protein [Deltaproteobacteria bacterium]|nr:substrate-binding domain-containing protein [Deltaproteobacteria bacterium]